MPPRSPSSFISRAASRDVKEIQFTTMPVGNVDGRSRGRAGDAPAQGAKPRRCRGRKMPEKTSLYASQPVKQSSIRDRDNTEGEHARTQRVIVGER